MLGTSLIILRDQRRARSGRSTTCAATEATGSLYFDDPRTETKGTCRQITCKYHGWRYDLDGSLAFVQQEGEFFDLDKFCRPGWCPAHCEVFAGFIFINVAKEPEQSLREFLGPMITDLEGYPFDEDDVSASRTAPSIEVELEDFHGRVPGVLPRTHRARRTVTGPVLECRPGGRVRGARITGSRRHTGSSAPPASSSGSCRTR